MPESSPSTKGGRIPPQDIDAEKSLLGAILISEKSFPEIITKIAPADFYDPRHAQIFQGMANLYNNGKPIDLLTLTAELRRSKNLRSVGGSPYLTELTTFVPAATHALAYADIIEQTALRRRLIEAGTQIATKAYADDSSVDELIGNAEKDLYAVSNQAGKSDYTSMEDLLINAFDRIENLHKNRGALRGLKTGFHDLDKLTAGLQKGDLIIVGARPAMGKTTFAQNVAVNVCNYNKDTGVLFFSAEMASNEIIDRMISEVSGIDNWKIRTGNISDADFAKIGDTLSEMSELPLYIDDTSALNIVELRNRARRAKHEHPEIGLIVIDYLQLLQGTDRYAGNRVQEVTEISRGLKTLARELEIPVMALAQLSRNVTGRENPRPVLSDLRESGSIEQDADLVMFLHRVDYYHIGEEDYEDTNITELILAKHRHGATNTVKLYFQKELNRFMSYDDTHAEQ